MNKLKSVDQYIEEYSGQVSRLCFFLCKNVHDADDLFQETFIKVLRNFDKYDSEKDFGKWVSSICINCYKDFCRKVSREKMITFNDNDEKDQFLQSIPADEEHQIGEYEELYKAIDTLTPDQRAVVILFYFQSYSEKECAQILGISAGKVKSRLYSARQSLLRRMNER